MSKPGRLHRIATLPFLAALSAVAACGDSPIATHPLNAPSFELIDATQRLGLSQITAHVYGSFRVNAGAGGTSVITSGAANFPGHPAAGPGTCVDGTWYNAQGKRTAGTLAKPHPHCVAPAAAIEVVLEPISACYSAFKAATTGGTTEEPPKDGGGAPTGSTTDPAGGTVGCVSKGDKTNYIGDLIFSKTPEISIRGLTSRADPAVGSTEGIGTVVGYAIDASTLGTTNRRVGTLSINLSQLNDATMDFLGSSGEGPCALDAAMLSPCINKVITASYEPLAAPAGVGLADATVEGFLWYTPQTSPYNYSGQ